MTKNALNIIYKSLVLPIIDYGICVYGFTYSTHLERIRRLQRRAARIITSSNDEYSVLFNELDWHTFDSRRDYFASIFIYKCINKLSANRCQSLFTFLNSNQSTRKTRSSGNEELFIPKSSLQSFKNTIFDKGLKTYNNIDKEVRKSSFKPFVTNLKIIFN